MPNIDKISQFIAEIFLLPFSEYKRPPYWEFYFRFRLWPMYCHWHIILHQPVKFRRNRTIGVKVTTSYRFFKMADIVNVLPGLVIVTALIWKEGNLFAHQFRWDISIPGWDKTKAENTILKFYFRFNILPVCIHGHIIWHLSKIL